MAVRAVPALVPTAAAALPVRELGEDGVPGRRVLVRRLAGLRLRSGKGGERVRMAKGGENWAEGSGWKGWAEG